MAEEIKHDRVQIRWKNFRGFRDTGWLEIKPLTILIGANNAGKTSLVAPLLLMDQTLSSPDQHMPLVTRGNLYDAGTFADLIRNHDKSNELFFGIRFHLHEHHDKVRPVDDYPPGCLELTFGAGKTAEEVLLKRYAVFDVFNRPYLYRSLQAAGNYSLAGIPTAHLKSLEHKVIRESRPTRFFFTPTTLLAGLQPKEGKGSSRSVSFSSSFVLYITVISEVFAQIRSLFDRLSYIGPLRERPRKYYQLTGETPKTVGSRGERAPNLVRRRFATLKKELNRWVGEFELGDQIEYKDMAEDLFSILFKKAKGRTHNISGSGFGASQVFPLIVQAVASKPRDIIIAEQPEIHLNPRLQIVLADLFVECASKNRTVIVETHSEHLLLRVRRLVASGKIPAQNVAIYFVERKAAESVVTLVPIQKNGHIEPQSWPTGFFGETLSESLALAEAQS